MYNKAIPKKITENYNAFLDIWQQNLNQEMKRREQS